MFKKVVIISVVSASAALAYVLQSQQDALLSSPNAAEELSSEQINTQPQTGRMAYIDPETGMLSSTPPASEKGLSRASVKVDTLPPVQYTRHANGTVQAKLNGRFRSPLMATLGCDGKVALAHIEQDNLKAGSKRAAPCEK